MDRATTPEATEADPVRLRALQGAADEAEDFARWFALTGAMDGKRYAAVGWPC